MESTRQTAVRTSLAFAANAFDVEARPIEVSAPTQDLQDLTVALGNALLALQAPDTDARSWKPGVGVEKEGAGVKVGKDEGKEGGDSTGRVLTEGAVENQGVQQGGKDEGVSDEKGGKLKSGGPTELGRASLTDSSSDIDLELQLELELSSTCSSRLGDVANKATSTSGLGDEGCESGNGEELESSRSVMQFIVGTEERSLFAHKEIVEARCPDALGALGWEGNTPGQPSARVSLNLPEFTPAGIWAALEFIYTARNKFSADEVWGVLQAAVFFGLDPLSERCIEVITASAADSSTWSMLEGGMLLGLKPLVDKALHLVAERTRSILTCTDFTSPSITAASVLRVVQRRDLAMYEKDLAKVLLCQWAESTKEPKASVDQVMRYISWPQVYEEDMGILSLGMRKRLLPDDVMAEILKWVGGPPKAEMIPNPMKIRYQHWTFLFRHPRCPPSKYKDVPPPELVNGEESSGKSQWIESSGTPGSFGVHIESGDHVSLQDTHGRLNATKCFSVEAWVRLVHPQNTNHSDFMGAIVSKHGPGAGWELRFNRNNVQFMVSLRCNHGHGSSSDWHEIADTSLGTENDNSTSWHHVAGTFNGKKVMVYVDGDCSGMVRIVGNDIGGDRKIHDDVELIHHFGPLCIGCNPFWKDRYINGDISGVRIYNDKVLSESELADRKVV